MKMESNVEDDDDDGGGRDWPSGQKCNSCKQSADQGSPIQPLGTWRSRCDVRWEITFDCILSMPITISNICYTNSATWDILYCQFVLETDFQDEGSRWIKHLDFATSVFLSEWKLISLPPLVCCPWWWQVAPGKELLIPKIAQSASWQLIGSMKSRAMRCAGGEKEDGFIRFLRVIQRIQRGHSVLLSTVLHIRLPFTLFQKQGQKVPRFHRIVHPSCMSFFKLSRTHCS